MATKKGIDWEEAKRFYLEPNEDGSLKTYEAVAEKYDVSMTMVEQMGKKYDWVKTRKSLGEKQTQVMIKTREQNIIDAEDRHLKIWKGLQSTALGLLSDYRVQKNKSASKLSKITSTLKTAIAGERVVLGLPNDVSKAEVTNFNKDFDLTPDELAEMDKIFKQNANTKPNQTGGEEESI